MEIVDEEPVPITVPPQIETLFVPEEEISMVLPDELTAPPQIETLPEPLLFSAAPLLSL